MEHGTQTLGFDPDEAAQELGLSAKQKAFAMALVRGANATQAARQAGYGGSGAALRSIASRAAKSPKVAAFRQWAENAGAGPTDTIGDMDDLKRHLWRTVRGGDKAAGLRATEILARVSALEADKPKPPRDPQAILTCIADILPEMAAALATKHSVNFKLTDEQEAEAERRRRAIALDYFRDHPDERARLAAEAKNTHPVVEHANGHAEHAPAAADGARHNEG